MLNALLASVSGKRWWPSLQDRHDAFYQQLTRESLQLRLRKDLLDYRQSQSCTEELRFASDGKQNAIQAVFEEFAIDDDVSHRKDVWTRERFDAFIDRRTGRSDNDLNEILWRCFCYNASYPFIKTHDSTHIDFAGWIQAVGLLAAHTDSNLGHQSMAGFLLYSMHNTEEQIKECSLRRFSSFARPCETSGSRTGLQTSDEPVLDLLDEIAKIARSQLPAPIASLTRTRPPSLGEIKPHVQKLIQEQDLSAMQTALEVPFSEMLVLLATAMRIGLRGDQGPYLTADSTPVDVEQAVAKAILIAAGVKDGMALTFSVYHGFVEKTGYREFYWHRTFDDAIVALWQALFWPASETMPNDEAPSPMMVLALDFLCPVAPSKQTPVERSSSTLSYSTDLTDGTDHSAEVFQCLTSGYNAKMILVQGTITQDDQEQPAIFIVLTSSPLSRTFDQGDVEEFYIGDEHVIMEITPVAHALWYSESKDKYTDIVTSSNEVLRFGPTDDGLELDFLSCKAVLSSSRKGAGGYVEVCVGPSDEIRTVSDAKAWKTCITIESINIYDCPGGVLEGLTQRRATTVHDESINVF